jgi:hypothetical protein
VTPSHSPFGISQKGQALGSWVCARIPKSPRTLESPRLTPWSGEATARPHCWPTIWAGGGAIASHIDNRGGLAGAAQVAIDGPIHAVPVDQQAGEISDMGVLPGDAVSVAPCCYSLNDMRQVVGFSCPAEPFAPSPGSCHYHERY